MWLSLCLPLLAVPDEKSTGGTFASQYQASGERPANRDIAPAEKRQWNHGGGGGGGGGFEESYTCWERVDMDGVELGDMSLLDNDDWIECKVCPAQALTVALLRPSFLLRSAAARSASTASASSSKKQTAAARAARSTRASAGGRAQSSPASRRRASRWTCLRSAPSL